MSNLTTDYRKLKILYKLCFRIHEKYIYRLENIPSKRDYIEKLKSKEYQKILFIVFCRSNKFSKHIPNEIVSNYFDIKNGEN
jgi:hypothetical protein